MKAKHIILIILAVILLGGSLVYIFRKPIMYAAVESRVHEYVDRSPNSETVKNEVRKLIEPSIVLFRTDKLSKDEIKTILTIFNDLKDNVDVAGLGTPLSDSEVRQRMQTIKNLLKKHQ